MKNLIVYEWKKLMCKKVTLICLVILAFLQIVMFQGNSIPSERFYVKEQGTFVTGKEAFERELDYVEPYAGTLTDEKVQAILEDYRSLVQAAADQEPVYLTDTTDIIHFLFGDEKGNWNHKTVSELFPNSSAPVLGYSYGYTNTLSYMEYLFILMGILLIIILSPIFCEEYSLHTDALLLTARKGHEHLAASKIAAGFLTALSMGGLTILIHTLLIYLYFGGKGGQTSVQLNGRFLFRPDSMTYSLNFQEAYILSCVLWMGGLLLLAGVVFLFSAYFRTSFLCLIAALTFYGVPPLAQSVGLDCVFMKVFPSCAMNITNTLQIPPVSLGGSALPFTCLIAAASLLLAIVCSLGAVRKFAGHKVS